MRKTLLAIGLVVGLVLPGLPAAAATRYTLSITTSTTRVPLNASYTLKGQLKPARSGVTVTRLLLQEGAWIASGSARTNASGSWSMRLTAPALGRHLTWKVRAKVGGKLVSSRAISLDAVAPLPSVSVDALGPWNLALGADVSWFQHGANADQTADPANAVDFAKMQQAGVRFVYLKASDSRDLGHTRAGKWYATDRTAAQAAGLFTGLYHYSYLPDSSDKNTVVADAKAQADKFLWRIAATGGITAQDISPALDMEESCVRATKGQCTARTTPALATLWALTFLERVELKTGRRPLLYSTPDWLENWLVPSSTLRMYPLWLARYGIDPSNASPNPFVKSSGGCYITAWTNADCTGSWQIWQHTNQAVGADYGVLSTTMDLDLIANNNLPRLLAGTWTAAAADQAPVAEATTINIDATALTLAGGAVVVNVRRPTGGMVSAGTINFSVDGVAVAPASIARTTSGTWTLQIAALPAGAQSLQFSFTDASAVHSDSSITLAAPTV